MKQISIIIIFLLSSMASAVHYSDFEINKQLNQVELEQLSTTYLRNYFSTDQPDAVIDQLLEADLTPLELEYILFQLLTEVSQQPPQDFHQNLINRMKTYPIQATRDADEGHLPVAIFNLNSKAYGLENIRTAYRTEQHFNQLLIRDIPEALTQIQEIFSLESTLRRPRWLGVKNSLASLSEKSLLKLSHYLIKQINSNSGLDELISHVGLQTGRIDLIEKALLSNQTRIREFTLRQLPQYLTTEAAQTQLLRHAQAGLDRKFSVSLLNQFKQDAHVEKFLIGQLNDKITAANAAFALSQSDSASLPLSLKNNYLKSNNPIEQKHILFALKLNQSDGAKMALNDLLPLLDHGSPEAQWINSFNSSSIGDLQ